jgi:hypothetical protein
VTGFVGQQGKQQKLQIRGAELAPGTKSTAASPVWVKAGSEVMAEAEEPAVGAAVPAGVVMTMAVETVTMVKKVQHESLDYLKSHCAI